MRWRPRSPCSTACARPAKWTARPSPKWSGASRSSSTPACASSPNLRRCGRSSSFGTRSRATAIGVADPAKRRFRYGVQVNSLGLTEQQPENNAYRILIEMLSVVLSRSARARAVQLPAWNEALGLPRPFDQQWSLRLQQIMAYETDLLEFGDIFDGSNEIAALVETLKREATRGTRRDRRDGRRERGDRDGLSQGASWSNRTRAGSRRSSAASRSSSASTPSPTPSPRR